MKRILVAIDFTPVTESMVIYTEKLATAFNATVTLLHVATPQPAFFEMIPSPQALESAIEEIYPEDYQQLRQLSERLESRGIATESKLVQGSTVNGIIDYAEMWQANLLIVGSHDHGSIYRALLGSIGGDVLKQTPCPLLVIPEISPPHHDD